MTQPDDRSPWEQLSREEWLTEEDKRIIAEATERFDKAFDVIFKGDKQEQP